jgi:hypothetical protein
MPVLAEVHLVSDPDDPFHPLRSQMISLPDHPAGLGEPFEAMALRATQRIRRKVRARSDPRDQRPTGLRT